MSDDLDDTEFIKCPICGKKGVLQLDSITFECQECGWYEQFTETL